MFKIIEGDFKNNKYSNEEYLDNWPMLYILENGKKAYIGESNHVKTRMTQHTTNEEKRIFNKVHFIYSRLFNQSVTFDYESKLIQYIVADELFQVTNKNSGIADKQYYEKGKYDKKFELLWRKLQQEKLVKHSLEEIENSDLFKYSPYKELNDSQRKAVEDILAQIESGNVNRVVVNGMPGSGKTIVAVYLMKYLADSDCFAWVNGVHVVVYCCVIGFRISSFKRLAVLGCLQSKIHECTGLGITGVCVIIVDHQT